MGFRQPWHGADAAQVVASDGHRFGRRAVARARHGPVGRVARGRVRDARAAVGDATGWCSRLAGVAAAWSVLVVAMSAVLGYAALSRFLLPAAALVCVLAGVGAVGR